MSEIEELKKRNESIKGYYHWCYICERNVDDPHHEHAVLEYEAKAVEAYKAELNSEITLLFQIINEDCSFFENGDEADKFQKILYLMVKSGIFQKVKDDNSGLYEFKQEAIQLIEGEKK